MGGVEALQHRITEEPAEAAAAAGRCLGNKVIEQRERTTSTRPGITREDPFPGGGGVVAFVVLVVLVVLVEQFEESILNGLFA